MDRNMLYCGEIMKRLYDMIEKDANSEMQKEDVTLSQMKMLTFLRGKDDSSATLKEMERYFDVSQATIAGIAARLEKKSMITGYTDERDRRIKHVRLTEDGRELCIRAKASMDRVEERLLCPLSSEERSLMRSYLMRMYDNLHPAAGAGEEQATQQ